jgi:hypothetical protein
VIVAYCAGCGGWTMFHVEPDSDTAKEWAAQCEKQGDTIVVRPTEPFSDRSCPSSLVAKRCTP